ncbi:O-acetyl-ADP-ribose deacetylase [Apibacter raozihei]|uniref:O-acetyl-ADP-ribose deacetylase n=1 Tax=Apibacter raozihei TaxID=2500547 RepID=UPI000FE40F6C|nr:O-acetyl-ADP-ribose deacetylase [Apibacter raozihei]
MGIQIIKGDITRINVDAIVNAANSSLLGGGGVDGAIHRAGGKQILEECQKIRARQGKCNTGEAVYTAAGCLPARYVIHTVGPVWNGGNKNEKDLLRQCYINSLRIADKLELKSVAFPNISTGIYHFPKNEASEIAINTVQYFFKKENKYIETILFVCYDEENEQLYKNKLR